MKKDLNAKGLNLDNRSEIVKKMMFEAGVGGVGNAKGDFEKAFRGMKPEEISKLSDSDIISKFQSVRGLRYADPGVGVRFEKEKQKMLAELGGGRRGDAPTTPEKKQQDEPKRFASVAAQSHGTILDSLFGLDQSKEDYQKRVAAQSHGGILATIGDKLGLTSSPEKMPAGTAPMSAMLTQNPWNQDTSDLDTGHHDIPKGAMGTGGDQQGGFLSSIGDSIMSGVESVGSALGLTPMKASLETPKLTTNSTGVKLAQASVANTDLNRMAQGSGGGGGNFINAPHHTTNNSNTTQTISLRAKNTDTSYERNQDAMFMPT